MYFFRELRYQPFILSRNLKLKQKVAVETDTHIAMPVMGIGGWIVYFLKRIPVLLVGTAVLFHVALGLFSVAVSVLYSFVNPPVTSLMAERMMDERYAPRLVKFVPLATLPEYAQAMYIRLEDKNFYTHNGVDFAAIQYAYEQNQRWGRVVMGGSTITQQLVRTLFLSQDKNYFRKYVEAAVSIVLDTVMDKKRILELYLNYIEWGKGIYGIGAAAEYYFKKPAASLTYDEYSRLATIIIDPLEYNVYNFYNHPSMVYRYYALNAPPSPSPSPLLSPTPSPSPSPTAKPKATTTPSVSSLPKKN
jgi:monofunctional biosynthetic peptidoglycan transglycosylase